MEFIVALINAGSDKVSFFAGLCLLLVAVFCHKPVTLGRIRLPRIDNLGRSVSLVIGLVLLGWPVFSWTAGSNVGLISREPAPQSVVLQAERPQEFMLPTGEAIGVFAYDISSRGTFHLLLFNVGRNAEQFIGKDVSHSALMQKIGQGAVIYDQALTRGGTYHFTLNGRQHSLQVKRVDWFLIGADYAVLEIE